MTSKLEAKEVKEKNAYLKQVNLEIKCYMIKIYISLCTGI